MNRKRSLSLGMIRALHDGLKIPPLFSFRSQSPTRLASVQPAIAENLLVDRIPSPPESDRGGNRAGSSRVKT